MNKPIAAWLAVLQILVLLHHGTAAETGCLQETTLVKPPPVLFYKKYRVNSTELNLFFPGLSFIQPMNLSVARIAATDKKNTDKDNYDVTVIGADTGIGDFIFNDSTRSLKRFSRLFPEVEFIRPADSTIDAHGNVYTGDTASPGIHAFFFDGKKLQYKKKIMIHALVYSLYLQETNRIIFSDNAAGIIGCFDPYSEKLLWSFRAAGVRGVCALSRNDIYNRYRQDVIHAVFSNGTAVLSADSGGKITDVKHFPGSDFYFLDMDYFNNIYLPDRKNHSIVKLSRKMEFITTFGSFGLSGISFNGPVGIAIHRRGGMVFISESTGAHYFWIGTDIKDLNIKKEHDKITLVYKLTEPAYVAYFLSSLPASDETEFPGKTAEQNYTLIERKRYVHNDIQYSFTPPDTQNKYTYFIISAVPTYSSKLFHSRNVTIDLADMKIIQHP